MMGRLLMLASTVAAGVAAAAAWILGRRGARRKARAQRRAERLAKRAGFEPGARSVETVLSDGPAAREAQETPMVASSAGPTQAGSREDGSAVEEAAAAADLESRLDHPAAEGTTDAEAGFQSIRGIGPAMADRLRGAGVTSVAQVAAWTDEDVETIAPLLRVTPDRIRTQAWVAQAQEVLGSRASDR